jgi:hypothetical protein
VEIKRRDVTDASILVRLEGVDCIWDSVRAGFRRLKGSLRDARRVVCVYAVIWML